jgi:hypothetical protein
MNKYFKIVIFGFVVWLVPFLVSFFIYPLKTAGNPLFESVMPLVITIITVSLACLYLIKLETDLIREGVIIGFSWFIINLAIDLVLFLPPSPMQMNFMNYMEDIGITYLIIPVITIGLAYMADNKIVA